MRRTKYRKSRYVDVAGSHLLSSHSFFPSKVLYPIFVSRPMPWDSYNLPPLLMPCPTFSRRQSHANSQWLSLYKGPHCNFFAFILFLRRLNCLQINNFLLWTEEYLSSAWQPPFSRLWLSLSPSWLIVYRCGKEHSETATDVAECCPQRGALCFASRCVPVPQITILALHCGQGEQNRESAQMWSDSWPLSPLPLNKNPVPHALAVGYWQNSSHETITATPSPD